MMNAFIEKESDVEEGNDKNAFNLRKITKAMHKGFIASEYETIEDYLLSKGINPKKYDIESYEAEYGEDENGD